MKINPITNPNVLKSYKNTTLPQEKTKVANGRDEVTFSDEALSYTKALAEAKGAIESRTPERKAHIAEVANAVRQGTYNISSDKIVERILESVKGRN